MVEVLEYTFLADWSDRADSMSLRPDSVTWTASAALEASADPVVMGSALLVEVEAALQAVREVCRPLTSGRSAVMRIISLIKLCRQRCDSRSQMSFMALYRHFAKEYRGSSGGINSQKYLRPAHLFHLLPNARTCSYMLHVGCCYIPSVYFKKKARIDSARKELCPRTEELSSRHRCASIIDFRKRTRTVTQDVYGGL